MFARVAPLVSPSTGLRFLKVLELDGSARYVKNSLSGGDVTWTGGDQILNACYDGAAFPNSFCGFIDRSADGQITFIRQGYFNAAAYTFEGLTTSVGYRREYGNFGTIGLNVNYLYRSKLETRVGDGDIDHLAGQIGYPRHSGTASVTYDKGGFNALVQVQYVGKGKYDVDESPTARDIGGNGDWYVVNATVGYDVSKQFGMRFIVDNIADRGPPAPYTGTYEQNQTYFSGIVGRSFRVAANVRF